MPCYDGRCGNCGREHSGQCDLNHIVQNRVYNEVQSYSDKQNKQLQIENSNLKQRNDQLVDMLCRIGKSIIRSEEVPNDIVDWMIEHEKWDTKRGKPWR